MSRTPIRALVPALLVLAVALTGCSGGSDSNASGDSGGDVKAAEAPAASRAEAGVPADADGVGGQAEAYDASGGRNRPGTDLMSRAVIRKGNVELRADDVGKAQFDVERVVRRYFGEVTEEQTTTDDAGKPAYTQMVLRIPTERFSDAMDDLKATESAELVAADSSENDVTSKMIDTRTRLVAQKRSIARITVLFSRAQSIRDIMAIEAELSRRQADLDSLERQLAFLRGQTSMSTISVSIDQTPATKAAPKKEEDHAGFLAGLSAGWHGLTATAVALATVLGALLPWLVVLVVLGPPALLVGRSVRRRISAGRSARTPSAA
jgi:hypothetical protein